MKKTFNNLLSHAMNGREDTDAAVRSNITIREDFKVLIPPLSQEEYQQLEDNISREGVRDPIILWRSGDSYVIVDGHNRFEICEKLQKQFPYVVLEFEDEEAAKDWMITNQLGRRNLSPENQSYLRGLRYNREKTQGSRHDLTSGQNDQKLEMTKAEALGAEYGVGEATIRRDGRFAAAVDLIGQRDPELKSEILSGRSNLSKKQVQQVASGVMTNKKKSARQAQPSLTARSVARIAIDFFSQEHGSLTPIAERLGIQLDPERPEEFFVQWQRAVKSDS